MTAQSLGAATLSYDAASRLSKTIINGTETQLLYDGTNLVAEYNSTGTLQKRYVHSNGIDEPIVVYDGATTTNKNWFYADHLGSNVALANTTGTATATYTYSPEGKQGGSAGIRFGYTGQQNLNGLGVQYYKARIYSADLGRFIQTDPIGMADDMNLYAYVGNNAVNYSDPSGLAQVAQNNGFSGESYQVAGAVTFGLYLGPGFEATVGNDQGRNFMTFRGGLGLGGGVSYDPNATIPGPALVDSSQRGTVISASSLTHFTFGPLVAAVEGGAARNYNNQQSVLYGGPSASLAPLSTFNGLSASYSIGGQFTMYSSDLRIPPNLTSPSR